MKDASKTIRNILRVNHAGEYGAIRIYAAQIAVAKLCCKDLVQHLEKMLQDEINHCDIFRSAMPERKTRPCYTMWLWSWGGYLLGLTTAIFGRNGIMVCTEAVEEAVHHHMNAQIAYLAGKDEALKSMIEAIKVEEVDHLSFAQDHVRHNRLTKTAYSIIYAATEVLIWLSTQGAITSMKADLKAANP